MMKSIKGRIVMLNCI